MTSINLERAAQEMWEIWGMDAHRICVQSAKRHGEIGETDMERGWNEIAAAVLKYIGPSPEGAELSGAVSCDPIRTSCPAPSGSTP
jgi:hypothetical protein